MPSNLLVLESSQYTELVSSKAVIKNALQIWKLRDHGFDQIPGYGNFNPVSLIRRALSRCPDETPLKSAAIIPFIDDNELRASLEIDISAATVALSNGEWKAATVLGGSVIEALLLWKLSKNEPENIKKAIEDLKKEKILASDPGTNLEQWNLSTFIEVASELKILGEDTAKQARLAKEYRNLIHPGREKRLGQKCNRGTALAVAAAVEFVIGDVSTRN